MTVYVYDKELKKVVPKAERGKSRDIAIKIGVEGRFVCQQVEPELGKGTKNAAPHYVDGQPAFTSVQQAREFGAAHGMVWDPDRPTPSEHRRELERQRDNRKAQRGKRISPW